MTAAELFTSSPKSRWPSGVFRSSATLFLFVFQPWKYWLSA